MTNKATVIIPTTGASSVVESIQSVLNQTIPTTCYVVVDGLEYKEKIDKIIKEISDDKMKVNFLPINVGKNGFYGHRVYSAFTNLIDTEFVLYLDQDCWMDSNHVESLIDIIESTNSQWGYSLRKICDKDGNYICNDDCESLGKWRPVMEYNHVDTNCYCIRTDIAVKVSNVWYGGWGTDRVFYSTVSHYFPNFECSGKYSLNYRLDGNEGSVKPEFFKHWNTVVQKNIEESYPWRKNNV